jgi:hypothetical protein
VVLTREDERGGGAEEAEEGGGLIAAEGGARHGISPGKRGEEGIGERERMDGVRVRPR